MVLQIRGRRLEKFPPSLEDFFDAFPEIGVANLCLTDLEHVSMWREEVLFIRQRQQATSDYRENQRVRWMGSHAALTCHIALMRHTETGVASIGHFDNYCCWQLGEESSAHRDGLDIMLDEIAHLSDGDADHGLVEVSVVGGYEDERGDAAKNSMSLLRALHEDARLIELRHFCVGPYNTIEANEEDKRIDRHIRLGPKTAILKGIAIDLKSGMIFPAVFNWGQFTDFQTQLRDRLRIRMGEQPQDSEDINKTADSTFKPKSLRNRAKEKKDKTATRKAAEEMEAAKRLRRNSWSGFMLEPGAIFSVRLKPTGINENARRKSKSKFINFHSQARKAEQ